MQLLFNAGLPPTMTVGDPGAHGDAVAGMQGIGVSTPKAALVAAATVGFARLLHMAKGGIFAKGILSMMLPAGLLHPITKLVPNELKVAGAAPKLHIINAPVVTRTAITSHLF